MATYYWVGGNGTWNNASTTNWSSTSGGAGGAGFPTTADNIIVNAASGAATISIGTSAVCLNADFTGFTGTVATGTVASINIYGDLNWPATATISVTNIYFPSVTTRTVNFNGCTLITVGFVIWLQNAGPYAVTLPNSLNTNVICDWSSSSTLSPTYNISGSGYSIASLQMSAYANGTGTATININSAITTGLIDDYFFSAANAKYILNINGNINLTNASSLRFNSPVGVINSTGYGFYQTITSSSTNSLQVSSVSGNAISYYATIFASSGSNVIFNLGTSNSSATAIYFKDFSIIQSTACQVNFKPNAGVYRADMYFSGTLTLNGFSQKYRIFAITSGYYSGLTATNVNLNNVDFYGITNTSSSTWVGTNLGNCGYNTSNITFTTAVKRYAVTANSDWNLIGWSSTSGGASGASSPLPQDTVYFDANTPIGTYNFTSTINTPNICTVDFTGFSQAITLSGSQYFYGGLTLSPTMTWNTGSNSCYFVGGTSNFITSNGKSFFQLFTGVPQVFGTSTAPSTPVTFTFVDTVNVTNSLNCYGNNIVNFLSDINASQLICGYAAGLNASVSSNVYNFNNTTLNASINSGSQSVFVQDSYGSNFITLTGNLNINVLGTSTSRKQIVSNPNNPFVIKSVNIIGTNNASNVYFYYSTTVTTITSQSRVKHTLAFPSSGTFTVTNFNVSGGYTLNNYLSLTVTGSTQSTLVKSGGGTVTLNNTIVTNVIASPTSTWFINNGAANNSPNWTVYGSIAKTSVAFLTSGTTYTVPAGLLSFTSIEGIGGGAGGGGSVGTGAGGAGAYSLGTTVAANITAGQTIYYSVGSGGTRGVNGGDTWVNIGSNTPPTTAAQGIVAKGGSTATTSTGGSGGLSYSGCVGDTLISGGNGGNYGSTGGGGGGASAVNSPYNYPGAGANGNTTGGGGGGAATGSNYPGTASVTGNGAGGNANFSLGTGAAGGATNASGSNATAGSGDGGGGGGSASAGTNVVNGGNGSTLTLWTATAGGTAGPGSGGGGVGQTSTVSTAGSGGLYGGGGGGPNGASATSGGSGAQGIIVLTYVIAADYTTPPLSSNTVNGTVGYVDLGPPDIAVGVLGNIAADYQVPLAGVYGTAFNPFILPSYNPSDVALGVLGNLTASAALYGLNTIDRTQEGITSTNGSNIMNISGLSPQGFQTFFASGQAYNLYYTVTDGINWETGLGQYVGTVTAGTITTVQVLASSNGGVAITKTIGMRIFITYAAAKTAILDNTGTCNIPFGPTNSVVGVNNVALATSMSS